MIRIIKMSSPGWTKDFSSVEEARLELLNHICSDCRVGRDVIVGVGEVWSDEPPDVSNIRDLLSTPCGCEFDLEM